MVMLSEGEATTLVVNDQPDQLSLMSLLMNKAGYRVLTAFDGREGLDVARAAHPEIVISDVSMPFMDGIELCRLVRADDELNRTAILLVSALRKDTASVIEGLTAGADDFLEAPYDPMLLIAKVAHLLERKRLEVTLREREERYRLLFDSNPQPMWVFDVKSLRFLAVNNAAVHHYGYSREEFLGMTIKDIRPPEDVDALLEDVAKDTRGLDAAGHWRHRKRDGSLIDVEITSHNLFFGERYAKLVLANDVTARRAAEEALRESEERFRQSQKMEAVGRLAGGIAHDFNNLLTAITGYSDLMLRRIEEHNPLRRNVEEVKKAAERAAALTRQLLAFSRKQVMQPRILNLNESIEEMDTMLRRLIGEDIDLAAVLAPNLGRVMADPGQIEQVLMNLVINSRDAMPRGGKLTIKTANVELDNAYTRKHISVESGAYVMLAISDTGCGMDAETQARIFEPFFTTKEAGKGTGLGLSTVYGIVKQSGGNIWVYSEVGRGTTFKIYLPRVKAAGAPTPVTIVETAARKGWETVLVVEDEDAIRDLIKEILEMSGYTVFVAESGKAALEFCQQHAEPIHLLVSDVVMPGMNGRELVEKVEALHPEIKVLYMSGYTDEAIVHHGVLDPDVEFLEKPFTPDALVRKVGALLESVG